MQDRVVSATEQPSDKTTEAKLRPDAFEEFVGQEVAVKRLIIAIEGAKQRKGQLDHVLFCAPPGIGKTTLAYIVSKQLGQKVTQALGTGLKDSDAVGLFSPLAGRKGILFIDELIRPSPKLVTCICKAMEERLFIRGYSSVMLQPFTLIAASTDVGSIPAPMRDRFVHVLHLTPYEDKDLVKIAGRSAELLDMETDPKGLTIVAERSRGTPRITNRLLKISRDFTSSLTRESATKIMKELGVDKLGLDAWDRSYLKLLAQRFSGGPVGLTTLAGALQETDKTIETVLEPYLLARGLIIKSGKGRMLTAQGAVVAAKSK